MKAALDWTEVAEQAKALLASPLVEAEAGLQLNQGQRDSLLALCERLSRNGVILADEVGMGKTRIAVALALCVTRAGGRVAIVAPPGLGGQWQRELLRAKLQTPELLRTHAQYLRAWSQDAPSKPWFDEPIVLLSHGFNRWASGPLPDSRWSLLPEVLAQYQRDVLGERLPSGYNVSDTLDDPETHAAGASIAGYIGRLPKRSLARTTLDAIRESIPVWKRSAEAEQYHARGALRPQLDRVTGLGLGVFDLVIIDEAHKSRGDDSLLSTLLSDVLVENAGARRVAMSATPVELDAGQWQQSLRRIHVHQATLPATIDAYVKGVEDLRRSPRDPQVEAAYVAAAARYKDALDPYLLRRDKREDDAVRRFVAQTGLPTNGYRDVDTLPVRLQSMTTGWRQAVCAAEALSFVSRMSEDSAGKRQRLTMGNGHGIARLIDETLDTEHQQQGDAADASTDAAKDKRTQRAGWWKAAMGRVIRSEHPDEDVLYRHPAITEAITFIETMASDEKVLVFARYRDPMQALTRLLNARAMLRAVKQGHPWPQRAVQEDEAAAVRVAHRQLYGQEVDLVALDEALRDGYRELENSRQRFRNGLLAKLRDGIAQLEGRQRTRYGELLAVLQASASTAHDGTTGGLAIVARALSDHLGEAAESGTPSEITASLMELVQAAANLDTATDDADDAAVEDDVHVGAQQSHEWEAVLARLDSDYSHAGGRFARQLHGGMEPGTRRLLQLAFNRPHAFPRVLVAQSMVGREGLNLHEACRTVVLLHLEWNPAVVEQQIGRVDRLGSLWQQRLQAAVEDATFQAEVPRIQVRQVVFEGTYDEGHWRVLAQRWDQLRAQLHGDILPQSAEPDAEYLALTERVALAAPRFSPTVVD